MLPGASRQVLWSSTNISPAGPCPLVTSSEHMFTRAEIAGIWDAILNTSPAESSDGIRKDKIFPASRPRPSDTMGSPLSLSLTAAVVMSTVRNLTLSAPRSASRRRVTENVTSGPVDCPVITAEIGSFRSAALNSDRTASIARHLASYGERSRSRARLISSAASAVISGLETTGFPSSPYMPRATAPVSRFTTKLSISIPPLAEPDVQEALT